MDDKPIGSSLLLPDLHIENFRGIRKLSIPRLGRVTLARRPQWRRQDDCIGCHQSLRGAWTAASINANLKQSGGSF